MNKFTTGWYLIYTKPRHEKKVHTRLAEAAIHSFLPTRTIPKFRHNGKKSIVEPLFPSYIFVYLNDMKNYYDSIHTDGALYYVRTGKEFARVSETVVNNIKLATGQAKDIEVCENCFLPGQQVVISKGALAGLCCEVVRLNGKQKLLVRVELLMRNLLLTLPEENLMAI